MQVDGYEYEFFLLTWGIECVECWEVVRWHEPVEVRRRGDEDQITVVTHLSCALERDGVVMVILSAWSVKDAHYRMLRML